MFSRVRQGPCFQREEDLSVKNVRTKIFVRKFKNKTPGYALEK